MPRAAIEVQDIYRDHGPGFRRARAGHLSLGQIKVMSAIERCRTAALGGHVAACEDWPPRARIGNGFVRPDTLTEVPTASKCGRISLGPLPSPSHHHRSERRRAASNPSQNISTTTIDIKIPIDRAAGTASALPARDFLP